MIRQFIKKTFRQINVGDIIKHPKIKLDPRLRENYNVYKKFKDYVVCLTQNLEMNKVQNIPCSVTESFIGERFSSINTNDSEKYYRMYERHVNESNEKHTFDLDLSKYKTSLLIPTVTYKGDIMDYIHKFKTNFNNSNSTIKQDVVSEQLKKQIIASTDNFNKYFLVNNFINYFALYDMNNVEKFYEITDIMTNQKKIIIKCNLVDDELNHIESPFYETLHITNDHEMNEKTTFPCSINAEIFHLISSVDGLKTTMEFVYETKRYEDCEFDVLDVHDNNQFKKLKI